METHDTKVYKGIRHKTEKPFSCTVLVNDKPLEDKFDKGFGWGYRGTMARNLAHCMIIDYFEDDAVPEEVWLPFFHDVITNIETDKDWEISGDRISKWVYRKFTQAQTDEEAEALYANAPDETIYVLSGEAIVENKDTEPVADDESEEPEELEYVDMEDLEEDNDVTFEDLEEIQEEPSYHPVPLSKPTRYNMDE